MIQLTPPKVRYCGSCSVVPAHLCFDFCRPCLAFAAEWQHLEDKERREQEATAQSIEQAEAEASAVDARYQDNPLEKRLGKCFICKEDAQQSLSSRPYCLKHERLYRREWDICVNAQCSRWAARVDSERFASCALHGGQDYQPRTSEAL